MIKIFLVVAGWGSHGGVLRRRDGETLAVLDPDEFQGKSVKSVKQCLAAKFGITRFQQKLLEEGSDGSEIPDAEGFACSSVKVQLVILDFWPLEKEQDQQLISASRENDAVALEELLQQPRTPNVTDATDGAGRTPLHHAAENGHATLLQLLLEAGAEKDAPASNGWAPCVFLHVCLPFCPCLFLCCALRWEECAEWDTDSHGLNTCGARLLGSMPATLPRRYLSHGSQCPILHILPIESAAEEQARAKREANVKENNNDLKVLDQAPAKAVTGSLQKVEILNARCGVGRIRQAAVAACCPFA